jgi:uncharacterized protein (TIGR03437 family)
VKKLLFAGSFFVVLVSAQSVQLKVANAASLQSQSAIAPRSLVTVTGQGLSSETALAADPGRLPMALAGVTMSVNGVPCPIVSVSPTQVTAFLDGSIQTGQVELSLETPTAFAIARIIVEPRSSPAMFTWSGKGSGNGAIINSVTFARESFSVTSGGYPTRLTWFANGLDASAPATVRVGGVAAPVESISDHPSFQGLQQINLRLAPEIAGAGRVEAMVEQRGRPSNATEIVILPEQGVFPSDLPNQTRSRELAAIAWVPNSGLALVADENDDVIRVVDLYLKRVTRVIALPDGAQPVALGVWGKGTLAVAALRGRDSIALLDLAAFNVASEIGVGRSPSAIAVSQDQAVVICSDSDSAYFFDFQSRELKGSAATGRLPRGVTADAQRAYVTNQSDGSITALDLITHSAVSTLKIGVDARPGAILSLPDDRMVVTAEPSTGLDGRVYFVNVGTGATFTLAANPEKNGGASNILKVGDTLYFANQTGGSVTASGTAVTTTTVSLVNPRNLRTEPGTRALAYDARDNLILALNEGAGSISLIDPVNFAVVGRIDAVRTAPSDDDDHLDRTSAKNLPALVLSAPGTIRSDTTFLLELSGTNLAAATAILFVDPQTVPGLERGRGHWNRGNIGQTDPGISVTDIRPDASGTVLTATVHVARGHATAPRLIRVLTPNGESPLANAPVLNVLQ